MTLSRLPHWTSEGEVQKERYKDIACSFDWMYSTTQNTLLSCSINLWCLMCKCCQMGAGCGSGAIVVIKKLRGLNNAPDCAKGSTFHRLCTEERPVLQNKHSCRFSLNVASNTGYIHGLTVTFMQVLTTIPQTDQPYRFTSSSAEILSEFPPGTWFIHKWTLHPDSSEALHWFYVGHSYGRATRRV